MSGRIRKFSTISTFAAWMSIAVASTAQTTAPAAGPDGTSPGSAPSPSATAVSPGAPSGSRVTDSTTPGRTYDDVSPGDSPRPGTTAVSPSSSRAPEALSSAPGTTGQPVDQALTRQSVPSQSQLAPLPKESAITAPGVAPGTPRLTVAPTRQPQAPVISPADQHAPATDNTVPTTASPIRTP